MPSPAAGHRIEITEVCLTTLEQDRGDKQLAYSRGRIPVHWIINLLDRQVEVFSYAGPEG
jgi:hypothetical protein